jgi:hypothetical protein
MNRLQKSLILIAAIALPAAAHSTFAPTPDNLCFASGATTYRIARNASAPDFRIKIAGEASNSGLRPDLRMQLVDSAEIADFVLVDDFSGSEPAPCRSSAPIRTVALDSGAARPDVTVELSADAAVPDYKIYVHSVRFSHEDAAALLAAMWKTQTRREATASIR